MRYLLSAFSFMALSFTLSAAPADLKPDFKNFTYPWVEDTDSVPAKWAWIDVSLSSGSARLIGGRHSFKSDGDGSSYLQFDSESRGTLRNVAGRVSAVTLRYGTGGTANWSYLYVYELLGAKAKLLGVLKSGSRADGGLLNVTIKDGLLILNFSDADRKSADCCSMGLSEFDIRVPGNSSVRLGQWDEERWRI